MTAYRTNLEYSFPDSDKEAIRNLALAQRGVMAVLDGFAQVLIEEDEEIESLWEAAKSLNTAVEVYCG